MSTTDSSTADGLRLLSEGTVAVRDGRVRGTVSGRGGCARSERAPYLPFALDEGTFDAALSTAYDSGLSITDLPSARHPAGRPGRHNVRDAALQRRP